MKIILVGESQPILRNILKLAGSEVNQVISQRPETIRAWRPEDNRSRPDLLLNFSRAVNDADASLLNRAFVDLSNQLEPRAGMSLLSPMNIANSRLRSSRALSRRGLPTLPSLYLKTTSLHGRINNPVIRPASFYSETAFVSGPELGEFVLPAAGQMPALPGTSFVPGVNLDPGAFLEIEHCQTAIVQPAIDWQRGDCLRILSSPKQSFGLSRAGPAPAKALLELEPVPANLAELAKAAVSASNLDFGEVAIFLANPDYLPLGDNPFSQSTDQRQLVLIGVDPGPNLLAPEATKLVALSLFEEYAERLETSGLVTRAEPIQPEPGPSPDPDSGGRGSGLGPG